MNILTTSQLPWKVSGYSIVTDDESVCIATAETDGGYEASPMQIHGNIELIVRSVNCHAELVAALQAVDDAHKSILEEDDGPSKMKMLIAHELVVKALLIAKPTAT